ncbi:nucleoside ABC transporter membrane protein [Kytococcus aerolatus]|uniref:Nucleoside ABC transporter membrane protein n=1 Tax=Kytococcus aerolatus TaxID=592308 RepID=A0A212TZD7_9MICO|nr:ABC transporter permease [Kytococcus aerolatus]SNC71365.1 nucleoside ABC transporter membrane protein [Kytococcus aerolatus]
MSTPLAEPTSERSPGLLQRLAGGSLLISLLSVVLAMLLGAVLIAFADETVRETASYLFARPTDFLGAVWTAVSEAYTALFKGAVFNPDANGLSRQIRPLTESLVFSVPLILAGLGVAVAFRAGLFNIGAQGQIILGAIIGGYLGFAFDLPPVVHLLVAALGGALGGALWGFVPGLLKSRTGANEVIVTIMLNYTAVYLLSFLLTQSAFQNPGSNQPKSPRVGDDALFPGLLGEGFRLNAAFLLAIAATVLVWWLLERSTLGFRMRAVGVNPAAARTAGMNVGAVTVAAMTVAGLLAGLAGTSQVQGTEQYLTAGIAGSLGFDAITVALLGRSRAGGVFLAGLLFGALKAGGFVMQSATQTPIDIILVLQSVIVLLIAAPALVRTVFRLPDPDRRRSAPPALTSTPTATQEASA